MAYIVEEIEYDQLSGVKVEVLERERGEQYETGQIIEVQMDYARSWLTPDELTDLGLWLIKQAQHIRNKYTPTGRVRKSQS